MSAVELAPRLSRDRPRLDLIRLPLVGRLLRWRHARTAFQVPMLLLAGLLVYDGLTGPQVAPQNLAGVLPWVHWRGLVVLALLLAGNLFCLACPFMLPRRLGKRLFGGRRTWPRHLRNKWLALAALVLFFWVYEAFDLWASPLLTAWLVVGYFLAAFVVDSLFQGAAFCKYVCPIGQFNFVNATASPVEVAVRDASVCGDCTTKDCIAGRYARPAPLAISTFVPLDQVRQDGPARGPLLQNGCELWLFQEKKVGNLDCTFCLDCVQACPHENVGLLARRPLAELWDGRRRSSLGRLAERRDLAALVLLIVFAAFVNAFGMVTPFYAAAQATAAALRTTSEPVVLAAIFGVGLILLPALSAGLAALATRRLALPGDGTLETATRFAYALAPVGFAMWLAHYLFHFLTGTLTIVPVVQSFLLDHGLPLLGEPRWGMGPVLPLSWLLPLELGLLELGWLGSLVAAYQLARTRVDDPALARRAALPWVVLATLLFAAGVWLLFQPMEMRGTFGG